MSTLEQLLTSPTNTRILSLSLKNHDFKTVALKWAAGQPLALFFSYFHNNSLIDNHMRLLRDLMFNDLRSPYGGLRGKIFLTMVILRYHDVPKPLYLKTAVPPVKPQTRPIPNSQQSELTWRGAPGGIVWPRLAADLGHGTVIILDKFGCD